MFNWEGNAFPRKGKERRRIHRRGSSSSARTISRGYLLLNESADICLVRGVAAFYRRRRAHVADSRLHTISTRRFPHQGLPRV